MKTTRHGGGPANKTRRLSSGMILGLLLVAMAACSKSPDQSHVDRGQPIALVPGLLEVSLPAIAPPQPAIASSVCAECHADVVEQYAQSPMSQSWRTLPDASVAGLPAGRVVDSQDRWVYEIDSANRRPVVTETATDSEFATHRLAVEADYLIGSGHHAQGLAARQGDDIRLLPVAYFTGVAEWRMSPGYVDGHPRFSRPVVEDCIACHATRGHALLPHLSQFAGAIVDGIACERCHGALDQHVARRRADSEAADDLPRLSAMSPDRQNDICFQCHLAGNVALHPPGKSAWTFQPGDRLVDHRVDFLLQTDERDAFGVASHGARMLQSRCYSASDGRLTCVTCHDPHAPIASSPAGEFDRGCQSCHASRDCSRERPAAPAAQSSPGEADSSRDDAALEHQDESEGCIGCHMPQRSTREGQHVVFTDHWIRRRPGRYEPAPPEIRSDRSLLLQPALPGSDPYGLRLGSAYIWLHEAIGPQPYALDRGVDLLLTAHGAGHRDVESDRFLLQGLFAQRRPEVAGDIARDALAKSPGNPRLLFELGRAARAAGDETTAAACFASLQAAVPQWSEPFGQGAGLLLSDGRIREAIPLLQGQLRAWESAGVHVDLARALGETGELAEALKHADRAVSLDPWMARGHLARGWVLAQQNQPAMAQQAFQRAMHCEPGNAAAKASLEALGVERSAP